MRARTQAALLGLALLGALASAGCAGFLGAADKPSPQTAVAAIPTLEVDVPTAFTTSPRSIASRSVIGTVLDPASLDNIESDAYVSFMKEITRTDGPDINVYIKRFQKYVAALAGVSSGATLSMSPSLGKASFTTSSTADGGLETKIWWRLPHTVSAATIARFTTITWPAATGLDGSLPINLDIYIDLVQDAAASLVNIDFQLISEETAVSADANLVTLPIVQIAASKDLAAGTYELYSLYYGNMKYEKSVRSGASVSFIKQIKRPAPTAVYPAGREYYYYGSGDGTAGGVTFLDYDPKYLNDPTNADNDIALHREIFDAAGSLLFKQYGLTSPSNTKLLADYNSANATNLAGALAANTVTVGNLVTSPWKLTISYTIDSAGLMTSVDSIKAGPATITTNLPVPPAGSTPKFYYEKTEGATSWAPGDAVYYPQGVSSVSGAGPFIVTQVFTRGFTVPNTTTILGQDLYVGNRYPLKYLALSGNSDGTLAYDNTSEPYAFYQFLDSLNAKTNIVWYDLSDVRHADGTYVPHLYWVAKQVTGSTLETYNPQTDLKIAGVEMHRAYTISTDSTTGLPIDTLAFVPVLATTPSSAPQSGDLGTGVTTSGVNGELPLFLNFTEEATVDGVLTKLTDAETGGIFSPGSLAYANFLATPTLAGFQPPASFPK